MKDESKTMLVSGESARSLQVAKGIKWRALGCLLLGMLLVPLSGRGETVDFEAPDYSLGSVDGQDGWWLASGTAAVTNGVLFASQSLGVDAGSYVVRDWYGPNYANKTTLKFKVSSLVGLTGKVRLGPTSSDSTAAVYVYLNSGNGFGVFTNGAFGGYVLDEFIEGNIYEVTCDIDFSAQTYNIAITNLSGTASGSRSDVPFYYAQSIKGFKDPYGSVRVDAAYNTLYIDDITVTPKEELLDFEAPLYVGSSSTIHGQNGWWVFSGEASVSDNGILSGAQELDVHAGSYVGRDWAGNLFTTNTTLKFKVARTGEVNGKVRIGDGSDESRMITYVYCGFGGGFAYFTKDASGGNVFSGYLLPWNAGEVYEVTCNIDFSTQTYDLLISNLTSGASVSVAGIDFYNPRTLADFTSLYGTVRVDASYNSIFVDDISVNGADLVDFETPTYVTSIPWMPLADQDGWGVSGGSVNVYSNAPSILSSGDQEVGVNAGGTAVREIQGSVFADQTTFMFKMGRGDDMTGRVRLFAGNNMSNTIVHIYSHFSGGIGVVNGGSVTYALGEFNSNKVYQVRTEIDFSAQTYDIVVNNLTDGTSGSIEGVAFEFPTSLADFQASNGTIQVEAQYSTLWIDDIALFGPLDPSVDTDGDGLPDWWELQYYGHITDNVGPTDPCANGINTALEAYIAVFNPTDPQAVFGLTGISEDAGNFVLQWDGIAGRKYTVYWSPNLTLGFALLQENIEGGSYTDAVNSAGSEGFYKLEVELAP